ncbi:MAG: dienelactone hydrolase family protein [Bauldia sp.]
MGKTIKLVAGDGRGFSAYEATPAAKPRGGVVIVQEIFGVNAHMRSVTDGYAAAGYRAIAPALFDRAEPGVELGYGAADRDRGMALRNAISLDQMLTDIGAAVAALSGAGKIGVIGYCLGGSLAWLAANRVAGVAAAVGYYGGMIAAHLDAKPRCPAMLHFGEEDSGIPLSDVKKIRSAVDPAVVQVFTYPGAGHAFNRDGTANWRAPAAKLAGERTLAFLRQHVG